MESGHSEESFVDTIAAGYSGPVIFSNKPSEKPSDDFIGLHAHVQAIRQAVDDGNRMIGVLSDFGAGKSTLIEQLQASYQNDNAHRVCKIDLWGELAHRQGTKSNDDQQNIAADLHKSFLYQFAQQISCRCGTYVNQRLNVGYKLLKLSVRNKSSFLLLLAATILLAWSLLFDKALLPFPWFLPQSLWSVFPMLLVLGTIMLIARFMTVSELLISSPKDQNKRELHAEDYSEIYQHILASAKEQHILIVYEDIDRTPDMQEVYRFLIEIHRYYAIIRNADAKSPKLVTFIINMKPQELFRRFNMTKNQGNLDFVKLFDYTLTLTPLNAADMPTLLEQYIQVNLPFYKSHQLALDETGTKLTAQIPGFGWLARGENLDIRHLKHRLNRTNQLFFALSENFIMDQKRAEAAIHGCAIVSYLEDEYPKGFYSLKSGSIGDMISAFMCQDNKTQDGWETVVQEVLCTLDPSDIEPGFARELAGFLKRQEIDENYRMYFFTYPKLCTVRTFQQDQVYNALIYDKKITATMQADIEAVCNKDSLLIQEAVDFRTGLQLLLPECVFACETLYLTVLRVERADAIRAYFEEQIQIENAEKTIRIISQVVQFEQWDTSKCKPQQKQIISLLRAQLKEGEQEKHARFRLMLTMAIKQRTSLFSELYLPPSKPLSVQEVDYLPEVRDVLRLLHANSVTPNVITLLTYRFLGQSEIFSEDHLALESLYRETLHRNGSGFNVAFYVPILCAHMIRVKTWDAEFEKFVYESIDDDPHAKDAYVAFINEMPNESVPEQVFSHIRQLNIRIGLKIEVCTQLLKRQFGAEYFCNARQYCLQNAWSEEEAELLAADASKLWQEDSALFMELRQRLCEYFADTVLTYQDAFKVPMMSPTKAEMDMLPLESVLQLLPLAEISENELRDIADYFCQTKRNYILTGKILDYVTQLADEELRCQLFQQLNFHLLDFAKVGRERKRLYEAAVADVFDFSEPTDMFGYMRKTNYLDKELEQRILDYVQQAGPKNCENVFSEYGALLSKLSDPEYSEVTLGIVHKDILCRNRPKKLLEKMFQEACNQYDYRTYVISLWYTNSKFIYEPERLHTLKDAYINLYLNSEHTRNKMIECPSVMQFLYEQSNFAQMTTEALLPFAKFPQTTALLEAVFAKEDTFIVSYFAHGAKRLSFANDDCRKYLVNALTDDSRPQLVLEARIQEIISPHLSKEDKKRFKNAKNRAKRRVLSGSIS